MFEIEKLLKVCNEAKEIMIVLHSKDGCREDIDFRNLHAALVGLFGEGYSAN